MHNEHTDIATTTTQRERKALFAGSFNPFTIGHQSLVDRGLELFDKIVVAVGISATKPVTQAEIAERLEPIRQLYAGDDRVEVVSYAGLTVDAAQSHGCQFLLRGIRNAIDLEYERQLADINRRISGLETVMLLTLPELSAVSSSTVRELQRYGRDVDEFLPKSKM
ncbi:MAG: pantetheine-phosphate adenylyltransferase [Bacteroidales bacterium]|nr:pantetheine-phosphate adenylyltransferase [Bacteroidales bacterium]